MIKYNPKKIEKKWQSKWDKDELYRAADKSKKPKYYQLETFPYPSGAGLHVGHPKGYIAEDIHARYMRMNGHEVLYTMGWDAFGLPTENYAIKIGKSPQEVAKANIKNFKRQVKMFGLSYDWDREIDTSSPEYYKWTQWLFIQLFNAGLAYRKKSLVNWCPKDQTVLANEQVVDGKCERDGEPVVQKEMEQWFFKITDYNERLLGGWEGLDWPEATIKRQKDWIGKSEGALLNFSLNGISGQKKGKHSVEVFTTRPDTLFGATFLVVSPELAKKWLDIGWQASGKTATYIKKSLDKKELDRLEAVGEKTGVDTGIKAINPATGEEIPVWIADYVLGSYGTGAIMAVPAHDERDLEFAAKFSLPIKEVVIPNIIDRRNPPVKGKKSVERKNVHAIVRDLETGKYLGLKWKKFDWTTFPMGGVEEGEDIVAAARREVEEETGFVNLKLVKVIEGQVRAEYFAAHKDENRISYTTAVVFDLVDRKQVEVNEKEKSTHDIIWMDSTKLNYENMTHAEVDIWNERLHSKNPAYMGDGVLINSGKFNGLDSEKAKKEIVKFVGGKKKVQYKLRDWSVSRQRYWGAPIPMIHCPKCGIVPVPEKDLPVKLPPLEDYRPKGKPPLASSEKFIKTNCPKCKGEATRDPETLDTFVDSSWYYLRYTDPGNKKKIFDKEKVSHWMPVDLYIIGAEHTVLHLLYSRFITKFLHDQGYLNFEEPFLKLRHVGLIQGEDGQKMSKSRGNVVNPDELVDRVGADTLRLYEMFMGPFENGQPWDSKSILGAYRFLNRVWTLYNKSETVNDNKELDHVLHRTIKKTGEDIENFRFNTAVSGFMKLLNEFEKYEHVSKDQAETFLKLLAPFAPHLSEEIWADVLKHKESIHLESWPVYDKKLVVEDFTDVIVQVNGKARGMVKLPVGSDEAKTREEASKEKNVSTHLKDKSIKKVIFIKDRLINFVI